MVGLGVTVAVGEGEGVGVGDAANGKLHPARHRIAPQGIRREIFIAAL